jgi:hypothetical protein
MFIKKRDREFDKIFLHDCFRRSICLTPGWVYVGVYGFTPQLSFCRNICFHSWVCLDVASVLTPCWVYAAAPGFIPCWVYVGVSGFPPRLSFSRNIW